MGILLGTSKGQQAARPGSGGALERLAPDQVRAERGVLEQLGDGGEVALFEGVADAVDVLLDRAVAEQEIDVAGQVG